jgi:hypothetical protein
MNVRPSIFAFAVILSSVCATTSAQAIPITVSFTASGFGAGAPTDPVTGSIVYDAASTTSNINSLTSVNLTIAGHTYTLGELGFISPSGTSQFIGGLLNGVDLVMVHTDDFFLTWNETTLVPSFFFYTTASSSLIPRSSNFTQFSVTAAAVPEPSSLALLLAGAACFGIVRRWRPRLGPHAHLRA